MNQPLLAVNNLTHLYAPDKGFRNVSFELWPGEVGRPAAVKPPC